MAPLSVVEAAGVVAAAVVVERQRRAAAQLDLSRGRLVAEWCQLVAWSALQVDGSVQVPRHGTCLWHGLEHGQSSQSFRLVGKRRVDPCSGRAGKDRNRKYKSVYLRFSIVSYGGLFKNFWSTYIHLKFSYFL